MNLKVCMWTHYLNMTLCYIDIRCMMNEIKYVTTKLRLDAMDDKILNAMFDCDEIKCNNRT